MEQDAIRIVQIGDDDRVHILDTTLLEGILNIPGIHDRSISVVSIAGAVRKGKSFILNFFLRYLKSWVRLT